MFDKLKAAWIVLWWALASVMFFVPICLGGLVDWSGRLAFHFCQGWTWVARVIAGVRFETVRKGEVDPTRSYVIVSNHQSLYDIPGLMLNLGLQFRWVIKKSFVYVPLFGWALWLTGHVFIDRSSPKKSLKSMDDAARKLRKGVSITVFPEGTRSDDGLVREFRSGGFLLAVRNNLPILPVTVNGSYKVLPNKRSMSFHPGKIQIVIGEPIETDGYTRKNLSELIERARDAVIENLDPEYPRD